MDLLIMRTQSRYMPAFHGAYCAPAWLDGLEKYPRPRPAEARSPRLQWASPRAQSRLVCPRDGQLLFVCAKRRLWEFIRHGCGSNGITGFHVCHQIGQLLYRHMACIFRHAQTYASCAFRDRELGGVIRGIDDGGHYSSVARLFNDRSSQNDSLNRGCGQMSGAP